MGGDAFTDAMNVVELVEWFEDVAAGRAGSRLVTLVSNDPIARLASLRSFYQSLAEHRSFGPVWPTVLPSGGLAPEFSAEYFLPAPKFTWLGIAASDEPVAEAVQLADQLEALAGLTNTPTWVKEASAGPFRATLGPQLFEGAGDSADHTFALLGQPVGGITTNLSVAVRMLDDIIEPHPLLPDGGALQLDAPRARARATIAAGWLQRLASHGPVILVVDEAHKAGPFLAELVDHVLAVAAPVLVVLSGEPASTAPSDGPTYRSRRGRSATPVAAPSSGPRLAGRFNTYQGQAVAAICLPGGTCGLVTATLAATLPSGVFTVNHVNAAATALGAAEPATILTELLASGWVRRLTRDVLSFVSDDRRAIALEQARGAFTDDQLAALRQQVGVAVAERAADNERLRTLVEVGGAESGADHDTTWRHARLLAAYGELARAQRLPLPATHPHTRGVTAAWHAATTGPTPRIDAGAETDPASLITFGALLARRDPVAANGLLARGIAGLSPSDRDGFTSDLQLRLAAARIFLTTGDLAGVDRALGSNLRHWLSQPAADQLARLAAWRTLPGMVSRTIDALANLDLIETLRSTMPGSVALTYALVARLELLERLGRLDTADDALALAWEAGHLLSNTVQRRPGITWRAVLWLAWANQRRGDTTTALALLDQLLAEQQEVLPEHHPSILATKLWRARCLLDAERFDEAHAELDHVLHHRLRTLESDHPDLLATHHWHAEVLAKLGNHAGAAEELNDVVAHRERFLAPDDEDLLASRHRLGSALANCGQFPDALRQFNEVIARRALLDIDDAPRMLAARHSRGVCLLMAGRHGEALSELDQVLDHRENHMAADAPLLVNARADRATCQLVLGRHAEALADLDIVIALRAARLGRDEPSLVNAHQQRVHCYLQLGRNREALAEIDAILDATAITWPAGDHMLNELRAIRAQLQPV